MSKLRAQENSVYGTPSPLSRQDPATIIAKRDPTTSDTGYPVGQTWANTSTGSFFALASTSGGSATWSTLGSVTSTFTTITATTFTTATAATRITISNGNVFTGTGSNAAVGFTFTPKGTGGLTLTTGALTATNGNLVLGTAGNGISIKSGANARIGQSTLAAGTVVVANSSVTANTRFILTRSSINGGVGANSIGSLGAVANVGVGFTINSYTSVATALATSDVSIVDWILVESA